MASSTSAGAGRRRRRRLTLLLPLAALVMLVGAFAIACLDVNWRFTRSSSPPPIRVYASPFFLAAGTPVTPGDLAERLTRVGYRKVDGETHTPGEFATRWRSWEIALNRYDGPGGSPEPRTVRVRLASGRIAGVEEAATGRRIDGAAIEPEPLGILSGDVREEKVPVRLDELPETLKEAVIAVEDRRFERHSGVDPIGIARAFFANLREGGVVQGGSTITQQLAKNLYEDQDHRTFTRKAWETLAAVGLELTRGKSAILERYLNEIYLAQRGPFAILGVGAASRHYFGKEARYLDLPESALLAGLIQSPGRYHPYRHPEAARARRDLVLRLMRAARFINDDAMKQAIASPLRLRPEPSDESRTAPYFLDYIAEGLKSSGLARAGGDGLRVFTTLDPLLQARAEKVLASRLERDERDNRTLRALPGGRLQGAIVALRPADGAILAMVGGRDYGESQFNRAAQARRQPGSLFKPFVYLAGFSQSQEAADDRFTAATVLEDAPLEEVVAGKTWTPLNYDREFRGPVTARAALANSLNVPTIRAAEGIGLDQVVRTARRCGIDSPLEPVPSIALGTFEVTPLEIAAAFTSFANLGRRASPRSVLAALDGRGRPLDVEGPVIRRVASSQATYLTVDLMRDVVRYGTAAGLSGWRLDGDVAGKTGTTDDGRDAWFVGLTPDFLALVWVGFDNNRPLKMGGAALAMPIWADLASAAHLDGALWEEPEGFTRADIDPTTGKLSGWHCPESQEEMFIEGTEPRESCDHDRSHDSWARRWFRWFRGD